MGTDGTLLQMRGISKRFPGVQALDRVDFDLEKGEVHALVGENGAGKSTLMKILAGALQKDEGEIVLEGKRVEIPNPIAARRLGISLIYQEFNLVPHLSVAENIFLGREPRRKSGLIDWNVLYQEAEKILSQLEVDIDVRRRVRHLSVAEQQMVEIARAVSVRSKILGMDEPSATLTEHELRRLFDLIRSLVASGVSVIYISHRLEEIYEIADRVTILRDGQRVSTDRVSNLTREEIVRRMVGREISDEFPPRQVQPGEEVLRVERLTRKGKFTDVSFSVRAGEILGIAGLVGAGRTEVARAIFGADPLDHGKIFLGGQELHLRGPRDAIDAGIGLVAEDRKAQGLILGMSVLENMTLPSLDRFSRWGFLDKASERRNAARFVDELRIRTPSLRQAVRNLSGGNQQKVVLAKWLLTHCRVMIFDEPTRGIDVGAKWEIYNLINALAERGVAIVMISSELPEILGMSDRILVMHEGRVAGELLRGEATQEKVMRLATGSS
ncbi:MAG: sugar ABC transporter ATP-binding protein [candidate division KSB1 bacterium]|nr:sugar ABC transporter ATP-binding protein [candidate division KSB1 bacterium]